MCVCTVKRLTCPPGEVCKVTPDDCLPGDECRDGPLPYCTGRSGLSPQATVPVSKLIYVVQ